MRVGIYARCSKDDGSQDPANQLHPLRDFAKALNGEIVEEYIDLASGGSSDRENFIRMLDDVDKHKFDLLLIWSLDRMSREGISTTLGYIDRFNRAGVALKSLQESWLDTRDEGLSGLMLAIFAWVARQERLRISQRTIAGLKRAEANGSRLGRPKGSKDKVRRVRSGYVKRWRRDKNKECVK